MPFPLTHEQRQAVSDRDGGLLVSAAAGSGKTRVLVERLMSRVEEGTDIDRFLIITYTKAAAAELRDRIVSGLRDRLDSDPANAHLRRQATLVYQTRISTIDAFCTAVLREEGHRLDLDHDFRVLDENEASALKLEALGEVLDRRYAAIAPGDDFSQLVDTMSAGRDDQRLMDIALDVYDRIQSHPDPLRWLDEQERRAALEGVADAGETPWGRLLLDDAARQAAYWAGQMGRLVELADLDPVLSRAYAGSLSRTEADLKRLAAAAEMGWDDAREARLIEFPKLGPATKCEAPLVKREIQLVRDRCKKRAEKLAGALNDSSSELLEDMRAVYPAIRGLFALIRELDEVYSALKRRRGVLDFSDAEHFTARLFTGDDGAPSALARHWGERFAEVMVDEYQDTNAVQNAIFTALTGGGKDLFMVGDVKQSIYRFRLAEPGIFMEKYRHFAPVETAAPGEERRVLLSQNFRSRPQVLEGVNYVFRSVMSETFGEMDYGDDEALIPGGVFPPTSGDCRVELDLVECAMPEETGPARSSQELEARYVARRIKELLDEGYPVKVDDTTTRPVECGDIVILLRSRSSVVHHYAAALGELDIPWEAEGGADFFASTEIQVAISLLQVIDNPRQDVALIAALRSAVYGFSADRLAQIRAAAGEEDFYTALTRDGGEDAAAFLSELAELRRRAGDESCDQLIWRLYDRTNLLGVYASMDEGEKRRANLLTLARLAREYEGQGHRGLFHFLLYLQQMREAGRSPDAPSSSGGAGVRILTIHRSKGLEFPVVFLAGLSRGFNRADLSRPILFHPGLGVGPKRLELERMLEYPTLSRLAVAQKLEREMAAEELRLLYVAMTRAKDKLIMTWSGKNLEKKLDKLLPFAGTPVEPQTLLECTDPGQWVLLPALARPEAEPLRGGFVPPVAKGTDFGPEWRIRMVEALEEPSHAKPQHREAERGDAGDGDSGLTAMLSWSYPYLADVELPSKLTTTELKGRDLDQEAAEEAPQPPRSPKFERPAFAAQRMGLTPAQRGTALHLVMQYIDFDRCGSEAAVRGEISRLVEQRFLTPQQAEAVEPERISRFFASPLGRELLAAPTLRREFKFSILVPAREYHPQAGEDERVLLQGVVDCCWETGEGITVVDFKTDHVYGGELARRAEEYRPQLEAYARALAGITGRPVVKLVLWFFSEGRAVEL